MLGEKILFELNEVEDGELRKFIEAFPEEIDDLQETNIDEERQTVKSVRSILLGEERNVQKIMIKYQSYSIASAFTYLGILRHKAWRYL